MDVAQLRTLIHVAELGSLSKAADRLRIAQPALSRQIRQLEEELGVQLFERHGRGMVITAVGAEVLDHAVRVMAELDSLRNTVAEGRSSFRGTVMIGATPTVGQMITLPLVKRIQAAHPLLSVRIATAFSGYLLDWLQRGDLEVAISYDPQTTRSLRIAPVMDENLLFVGPPQERLELSKPAPFSRLADYELILPSPRHGLRRIVDDCARSAGVALRTRVEVESFNVMVDLVREGLGMTVLPLAPIAPLVEQGALTAAPLTDPSPSRRLVVAYSAERPINPAARFVGREFAAIAADFVARNVWAGRMLEGEHG